jgi:hypothetical protein
MEKAEFVRKAPGYHVAGIDRTSRFVRVAHETGIDTDDERAQPLIRVRQNGRAPSLPTLMAEAV